MIDYSLEVVTAGAAVVTLEQAKTQCRIELAETFDDTFLNELIEEATEEVEYQSDISLQPTTYLLKMARFPCSHDQAIYLPRPPLVSVDDVSYIDTNGDEQTLTGVQVSTGQMSSLSIDIGSSWPSVRRLKDAVKITYTAGNANYPKRARRAILLLVGHWYLHRDVEHEIPVSVERIIEQLRPGDDHTRPDRPIRAA